MLEIFLEAENIRFVYGHYVVKYTSSKHERMMKCMLLLRQHNGDQFNTQINQAP